MPTRPVPIRIPWALAADDAYHHLRSTSLDTIVALSVLASDSRRHRDEVFAPLGQAVARGSGRLDAAKDADWEGLTISTTTAELGAVVGHHRRPDAVLADLRRLSATVDPLGAKLVSGHRNVRPRRVFVTATISPWWNAAARGAGGHTYILPAAYRCLSPLERRCYIWLAGWAGISGRKHHIELDTLSAHLWPDAPPSAVARRRRRQRIRAALAAIDGLPDHGWRISEADGMVSVARRRAEPAATAAPVPSSEAGAAVGFLEPEEVAESEPWEGVEELYGQDLREPTPEEVVEWMAVPPEAEEVRREPLALVPTTFDDQSWDLAEEA